MASPIQVKRKLKKRSLRNRTVLVTGGAGFIGSHLVDRLIREEPKAIVVIDNLFLGKKENLEQAKQILGSRLKCFWEDAGNEKGIRSLIRREKVDVVYDLAVIPLPASLVRPMFTVMENTRLTTILCELLRQREFKSLIHFSSSEVYGTACVVPMNENHPLQRSTPYAASKIAGDMVALSYQYTFDLDITLLRPFNNFGPRQNAGNFAGIIPEVIRRVQTGQPIWINGDGEQTRDFIFVGDTADAAVLAYEVSEAKGNVINVGSGRETSVNRMVKTLLSILGRPHHTVRRRCARLGDIRRHCGGARLARQILGFKPKVGLIQGLKETVAWYLSEKKRKAFDSITHPSKHRRK